MAGGSGWAVRAGALVKTYDETAGPVLRGVDLEVREGSFVAIMGPSGSGKSTLLHLLGGLDTPTSGEVEIGGRSLSDLDDEALAAVRRDTIGFIFQAYNLVPVLSVAENIALPRVIANAAPATYAERLARCLDLVGLADRRDHLPSQLSGGQQQRVAMARALLPGPAVVLADEPTGNLDTQTSGEVLSLLRQLVDEEGTTVLMVTHDPKCAAAADEVVLLVDGVVAGRMEPTHSQDLDTRSSAVLEWMASGGTAAPRVARSRRRPARPAPAAS